MLKDVASGCSPAVDGGHCVEAQAGCRGGIIVHLTGLKTINE